MAHPPSSPSRYRPVTPVTSATSTATMRTHHASAAACLFVFAVFPRFAVLTVFATFALFSAAHVSAQDAQAQELDDTPANLVANEISEVDAQATLNKPFINGQAAVALNFREATLQTIVDYLSETAGLIVVNDADLDARITLINRQPVTLDEAVGLLNTVLKDKGFTAIRRERLLRIVNLADAKRMSVPVRVGADPAKIGMTDTIMTQIIPIRYADAAGLAADLAPLVSTDYAELTANKSSNSLIVTNTEANIRRIAEIAQALDQSISQVRDVRVFHLRYAAATQTAALINNIFKAQPTTTSTDTIGRAFRRQFGRGSQPEAEQPDSTGAAPDVTAAADERGNAVVVSAAPDVMNVIATVVQQLDTDTTAKEAVMIYHARNAMATELQTLFTTLFADDSRSTSTAAGGQNNRRGSFNQNQNQAASQQQDDGGAADLVGNVKAVADESTNTLLVLTAEANFQRIRDILHDLDRPVPQVLVRVLVAELSHDDSLDLGVEWTANGQIGDSVVQALTTFGAASNGLGFMVFNDEFTVSVQALETAGILDVLSRPYILTRDNQTANILVGEEVPFITNSRVTDNGNTINTIDYRDIGIILGVTPQINGDGLVVLNVSQELSSLQSSTVQFSEGLNAPRVAKRTAETRIAVNDGQTVVIGGLMQDRVTKTIRKVPLLGDIPLIGHLFKRTEETRGKSELLLFLTPEVVMDPADLVGMSENIRNESENIEQTVEPGALQRHLDKMRGRDRSKDTAPIGTYD